MSTAPPKTDSARTAAGHNRQLGLNDVDNNAMPDVNSCRSSSNMIGVEEEDLEDPRTTADEGAQSTSTDPEESENDQDVPFTEQVRNES